MIHFFLQWGLNYILFVCFQRQMGSNRSQKEHICKGYSIQRKILGSQTLPCSECQVKYFDKDFRQILIQIKDYQMRLDKSKVA